MRDNSWVTYNKNAEIVEIILRDFSGAKIESFRFNCQDSERAGKVLNILKEKYNFAPEIKPNEHVSKDKDIDWLKKADW